MWNLGKCNLIEDIKKLEKLNKNQVTPDYVEQLHVAYGN